MWFSMNYSKFNMFNVMVTKGPPISKPAGEGVWFLYFLQDFFSCKWDQDFFSASHRARIFFLIGKAVKQNFLVCFVESHVHAHTKSKWRCLLYYVILVLVNHQQNIMGPIIIINHLHNVAGILWFLQVMKQLENILTKQYISEKSRVNNTFHTLHRWSRYTHLYFFSTVV